MRFCTYQMSDSREVRMGAVAPWSDHALIDVHRAEVALLANRTTSRRAHEIAEHLVPAAPEAFLAAGAHVWEFARDAIAEATPDAVTPRGEPVAVPLASCTRVAVAGQLLSTADLVHVGLRDGDDLPVLAVIGRHADAVSVDDAWTFVAGFVDIANQPTWLHTSDELAPDDADMYCAVAVAVSVHSHVAPLLPGDVVCSASVLEHVRSSRFEDLLLTA